MYDMPDDEILGFWGKRPFIGKGFAHPPEHKDSEPLKLPALLPVVEQSLDRPHPYTEALPSWHEDPALFPRLNLRLAVDSVGEMGV
jgi:hypothetical protein